MHASICPRKVDRKANFRNRKGTLSLNVMAMCGPNYIFDFVCCAFPGSCHDSFIEKNSELHVEYEVKKNLPFPDALVLGDCAYCRSYKWLCTPLLEGTLGDDPHSSRDDGLTSTIGSSVLNNIFGTSRIWTLTWCKVLNLLTTPKIQFCGLSSCLPRILATPSLNL